MRSNPYRRCSPVTTFLLLFLTALTGSDARAQFKEGGYYQKKYGVADGYTGTRCVLTFRDHSGRFWLSNHFGVSAFDGTEFTSYTTRDGLGNGSVICFAEDRNGVFYTGDGRTISTWARNRRPQFRTFYQLPAGASFSDIVIIDSNDFYYNNDAGTSVTHVVNKKPVPVPGPAEPIIRMTRNGDIVYGISQDAMICVFRNGRVEGKYPTTTTAVGIALPPFVADGSGNTWFIGQKLYKLTPTGMTDSLPLPPDAATEYYRVAFDGPGKRFYAMTRNWLYHYDGSNLVMQPDLHLSTADSTQAAVSSLCRGLYTDGNGTLYKADDILGFAQLKRLNYYTTEKFHWIPASDGRNGRVYRFDTSLAHHQDIQYVLPGIGAKILSLYDDRQGNTLYCLLDGLAIQKKGTKEYQYLYQSGGTAENGGTIGDGSIGIVLEDGKGDLWAKGLTRIVHLYRDGRKKIFGTEASHYLICLDKHNHLWTSGGGRAYVCDDDTIRDVTAALPVRLKNITALVNDRNGDVWISGSNYTIYKITPDGKGKYTCTDSVVLDNRNKVLDVQGIQFDRHGNLWAAFPDCIYAFTADQQGRFSSSRYKCFTPEDGMSDVLGGQLINLQRTADGNIILTEPPMPVLRVDELLQSSGKEVPQPYFTGLQLFGRDHDWVTDGFNVREDGLPAKLRLPYNRNALTFRFSSFGFHNLPYYHYQYRLAGMEDDWQEADVTRKATYTGLRPGRYTFLVRVANENGVWGPELSYPFTIAPPWYRSWWAIALWILLGGGTLFAAFYLRQRAIVKKYQVEQMITEQKLIALRAQINPHFLQNTFAFLAQHVLYETKEVTVNAIKRVSAYLRNVLHGSDHSIVTLEAELEFAQEYLQLQQMLLSDRFTYSVNVADDVDTFGINVPSMLLQPVVENAVKYGTMHNEPCVITLAVTNETPYVVCTVHNTNYQEGMAGKNSEHVSKGTQLTRSKLELMFAKSRNKPVFAAAPDGQGGYAVTIKIPVV